MRKLRISSVLRTVAIFEAAKGLLVLVVGFGLFSLLHVDVERLAEKLVMHFHLDAANRYPRIFLNLAAQMTDGRLWVLAVFALVYAAVRFTEAYGLWRGRPWAEWFAALSGGIYIPFEIREISHNPNVLTVGTLMVNIAIVSFMVYSLRHQSEVEAEQVIAAHHRM